MSRRLRNAVVVLAAASVLATFALHLLWPLESGQYDSAGTRVWIAGFAPYPVAAAFLLIRRSDNRVGWALGLSALSAGGLFFGGWVGVRFPDSTLSAYVEASSRIWGGTQFYGIIILLYVFPTGSAITPRFGKALRFFIAGAASLTLIELFCPRPLEATERENPLGWLPDWSTTVVEFGAIFVLAATVTGIISLIRRWRRSGYTERTQMKWLLAAAWFSLSVIFVVVITWDAQPDLPVDPVFLLMVAAFWSFPLAIAIAVLRYRLYDIDVLINRTLVYGSLTAATIGSYVLLVFTLSWAARSLTGEQGNEVVVAATTLIVAALFQPARRRIQRLVDRRFYRSRYDAARTLAAFQLRLRDEVDLPTLKRDLSHVVSTTLQPQGVGVWLKDARTR